MKTKTLEVVNYHDMIDVIEAKHNINVRDFLGKFNAVSSGQNSEDIEYCDFWHWMIEEVIPDVHNGMIEEINWSDIRYDARLNAESDEEFDASWTTKILNMLVDEFGDRVYNVEFSW